MVIPPRFRPLFDAIFYRNHDRVNVIAPTQDGKSMTIAAAVVLVASTMDERFTIVAPSEKKAGIIMGEVIELATQNKIIASQLELDKTNTLDRLRRERSKRQITFINGGGVQTLTLDARNQKNSFKAAMGFGAKNVIADEAGLIGDPLWATVMRMLGGDFKGEKRRKILIKIGNPFFRNHFHRSGQDKKYLRIFHNYLDSVKDYENGFYGYSPDYIEEMREEAFFEVFYECEFPKEDLIDAKGFRQLMTTADLKVCEKDKVKPIGKLLKIGVDLAGGGDYNTFIGRWQNIAKVLEKTKSNDTMTNVTMIQKLLKDYPDLQDRDINIDDIGIGRGVRDRCHELGIMVTGVAVGSTANVDTLKYANIKAQCSWFTRQWVREGKYLEEYKMAYRSVWEQCLWVKYKSNSDKQLMIEPKIELTRRTGKSPDFYEGLMLSFYEPPYIGF